MIFHPISLKDREWMTQKLKEEELGACEYTFSNNFIWSDVYEVEVGQVFDCGIIRYKEQEHFKYSFPFGNGDKKKVIEWLRELCAANKDKLVMYPVLEEERKKLIEWFPGEFDIDSDRGDFDYVYTVEKLTTLRGKKLHGKRNHIARFKDEEDWNYEPLNQENIDGCRRMAKLWMEQREDKWNFEMEQELKVLEKAFSFYDELGLFGGVLRKKGEIVAFTIGEPLNSDTMVVHFEKAFPELQGAYPMINQQFVLHEGQNFVYVNREEDTGDLTLRKAKMSYYPDVLLKKYNAMESHVVYANENDKEHITAIWQQCFGDSKEYIQMYLNQRFKEETMLVIFEAGKPVSMASFLPVQVLINGEPVAARYVYAVGTLPNYRGKGYAKEIIKYGAEKYMEPLILQPADETMERYYAGLGFEKGFDPSPCWIYEGSPDWKKGNVNPMLEGNIGKWELESIKAADYKRLRDVYFAAEGYVEWDEAGIQYALDENVFCGGQAWKLTCGERVEILMYRIEEEKLCIVETTMQEEELRLILPEIMQSIGVSKAYSSNTGGMILLPKSIVWAEKKGYLNLTLG
ncbi:MAG: GNAT family N-acetyltransferase [Lachnospiraceae bacterium]|nr:GNAT family N-acetyltransferase [Lachnospiraceae bacterium]